MYLKIQHFVIFITITLSLSCRDRDVHLSEIHGSQIAVEASLEASDSIENFIAPYRSHVNKVLDDPLCYAPSIITKNDGKYNSSAGNLMADIVLDQAGPVFTKRTGKKLDFVVLNHGGIRSVISAGEVSARTAYEVMPFENTIVVLEMQGKAIRELISYLIQSGRPHPVAGIQIILSADGELESVNIQGQPFDENRSYSVGTSNYLATGGDNMKFFQSGTASTDLQYLIRKAMIDYFTKIDTLKAGVDDRFIKRDQ